MKITNDMKVSIATDSSQGKYISISRNGNTLEVKSTNKKPKGGAKPTLKKIEKILEVIELDAPSKIRLNKLSKEIDRNYSQKNDKKFFYKLHSKKVHKHAKRIFYLTKVKPPPQDTFTIIGQFLNAQGVGRLSQVNKSASAPLEIEWVRRAQHLGWPGNGTAIEAKAFCQELAKCFNFLGLHWMGNRFISNPQKKLNIILLSRIGNTHISGLCNLDELQPLLYFLSYKTQGWQSPGFILGGQSWRYWFSSCSTWKQNANLNTLMPLAQLIANIHYLPDLNWFITSDINKNDAQTLLRLLPQKNLDLASPLRNSRNITTALHQAIEKGHIGWVKALLEEKANPNALSTIYPLGSNIPHAQSPIDLACEKRNSEIITLLIKSKASLPQSSFFITRTLINNSSLQVLLILNKLQDEKSPIIHTLMNSRPYNHYLTPLQLAILHDHGQEVLEKLVELGAIVSPSKRSFSPLLFAQKHKKMQAAIWLINQGASIPPKKRFFN